MTPPSEPFVVVKVGGSLVSDKQKLSNLDLDVVTKYAEQLARLARDHRGRLGLVAGGGAIGHGAVRGIPDDSFASLPLTKATYDVKWAWATALNNSGAPAMPVQLAGTAVLDRQGVLVGGWHAIKRMLDCGVIPVLSGDCVLRQDGSLEIYGSDRVPEVFINAVGNDVRVITLTDVPGVYRDGADSSILLHHIDSNSTDFSSIAEWNHDPWDTSGAMYGKVIALARLAQLGAECVITRGDPDLRSLGHFYRPLAEWPEDIGRTVIGPATPLGKKSNSQTPQGEL